MHFWNIAYFDLTFFSLLQAAGKSAEMTRMLDPANNCEAMRKCIYQAECDDEYYIPFIAPRVFILTLFFYFFFSTDTFLKNMNFIICLKFNS